MLKRKAKWRIIKRTSGWLVYKRYLDKGPMPYVIPGSAACFGTWAEAVDWVRSDGR